MSLTNWPDRNIWSNMCNFFTKTKSQVSALLHCAILTHNQGNTTQHVITLPVLHMAKTEFFGPWNRFESWDY